MKKNLESETLLTMEEEDADLLEADLKTVLEITGSYLYSGAELSDVEESVFLRIFELTKQHLTEEPYRIPKGTTIH